jgi:hypothetical protein
MDELLRQSWITSCQISESVDLVGFLQIQTGRQPVVLISTRFLQKGWTRRRLAEALRIYLASVTSNQFEERPLGQFLQLGSEESPVYQVITNQEIWPFGLDDRSHASYPNKHVENSRQMLTDPFCVEMEADLRKGIHYLAFSNGNYYEWSSAYSILKLCAESRNPKIYQCCLRLLELVYRHSGDPRLLEWYEYGNLGHILAM